MTDTTPNAPKAAAPAVAEAADELMALADAYATSFFKFVRYGHDIEYGERYEAARTALRSALEAAVKDALEQAAKVCDDLEDGEERRWAAERCAERIRTLAKDYQ